MKVISNFIALARLDKPVGIFLLFWPTFWALLFATQGSIALTDLLIFSLGVVITRSAGCVLNDLLDQDFDKTVNRTSNRPLASKKIKTKDAIYFFLSLLFLAATLVYFINQDAYILIFLALILLVIYPLSKRFFCIPQLFLAAAFSIPILIVYKHLGIALDKTSWTLFLANFFWVMAYDTVYALADLPDDEKIEIYSAPKTFGKYVHKVILSFYLLSSLLFLFLGQLTQFSMHYFVLILWLLLGIFYYYRKFVFIKKEYINFFIKNNWLGLFWSVLFYYFL